MIIADCVFAIWLTNTPTRNDAKLARKEKSKQDVYLYLRIIETKNASKKTTPTS